MKINKGLFLHLLVFFGYCCMIAYINSGETFNIEQRIMTCFFFALTQVVTLGFTLGCELYDKCFYIELPSFKK